MTDDTPITVAVISDTHLRSTDRRAQDRLDAWDQAIEKAGRFVDLWVHGGDVFDEKSTIEDRLAAADRFRRMAEIAPVVVLYGNHDVEKDLDIFGYLDSEYDIVIISAAQITDVLVDGNKVRLFALNYPHKTKLVEAGVPQDQIAGEVDKALDAIFAQAAMKFRSAEEQRMACLTVGHATISGSVSSVGQPMVGKEIEVSPIHLKRLGNVPAIFGHIHKPQVVHGAIHTGSLCRLDYGETEEKRFLLVRYERFSGRLIEVKSVPLSTPVRYHVEGSMTRAEGFSWQVKRGPDGPAEEPPASWVGHDVRVKVRYPEQERDVLGSIRKIAAEPFVGARNIDVETIAVHQRELRAPEVVAAETLDEKLAAWARLSGVTWSGTMAERANDLLASVDPDAVVAAVRERVKMLADDEREEKVADGEL